MKKMRKRIIALAMVLTMMFPCTAFAAESNEDSINSNNVVTATAEMETSDFDGIKIPRSTTYINTSGNNLSNGASYSDHFALSRDQQIITQLSVTGSARLVVKVSKYSWSTQYTYLDETITNGSSSKISNAVYDAGNYVWVYLYSQQDNTSYTLKVMGN